jgi:flavorubredoxin
MTDIDVPTFPARDGKLRLSGPVTLVDGKLHLLGSSMPVDGRISWYPEADRGRFVPFNSYLLREGEGILVVEAGVPAVFDQTARQLRAILGERCVIDRLAVTRNEPDCVSNVPRMVREFGLKSVHSPGLMNTLQFFPSDEAELKERAFDHAATELQMLNFGVGCTPSAPGGEVRISHDRALEVVAAPLKVLPTVWYYDRAARTMFCSDSFSDETAVGAETRILAGVDRQDVLIARFHESFSRKFDWLARSDLSSVIADLENIFDRYDIEILAPNRGLVVQGREAVLAKTAALLAALSELHGN